MAVISSETIKIEIQGVDGVTRSYQAVSDAQKRTEKSTKDVDRSIRNSGDAFGSFKGKIVAAQAALGLFSAAASVAGRAMGALKVPADLAISFEQGFAKITTLLDGPTESFGKLKNELLNLAADVPQTAEDISLAAYQAISAGIPHEEVASFLKTASKTAVGAGSTLTEAVEVLTTSVNGFKVESMDASKAANILFATQKQGVTTVKELQQNLGKATGLAQFGVKMDEVTAAVAQMTKLGTPTSEAFTRVVAVVKALSQETGPAAKNLKALGVEVGVTALKNKGLAGVLADVQEKTGGSARVISGLTRRFEAQDGMLKLLGSNFGDFNEILEGNRKEVNYVGDAYNKMDNTTQGAINSFNALKEDVLRRLGERMLPMVNEGLERLSNFLKNSGDELIDSFASGLQALFNFGIWIVEHSKEILLFLKGMFATKMITGFVQMMSVAVTRLQAFAAAAAAAGATAGGTLKAGLQAAAGAAMRSPNVLSAIVGLGMVLGDKLGTAIGEAMTEETEAAARHAAAVVEKSAAETKARVTQLTGMTQEEFLKFADERLTGTRLGLDVRINFGRETKDGRVFLDTVDEAKEKLKQMQTPTEMFNRILGEINEKNKKAVELNGAGAEQIDATAVAYEKVSDAIARTVEKLEDRRDRAIDEHNAQIDQLETQQDQLSHARMMVNARVKTTVYQARILELEQAIAQTKANIAQEALTVAERERAILKLKQQQAALDPKSPKNKGGIPGVPGTKPKGGGGGGKSKAQKAKEREQKEAERIEKENINFLDQIAKTEGQLLDLRNEVRRQALKTEMGIIGEREIIVRDANGREIRARVEHLKKLDVLDGDMITAMRFGNARFADEHDDKLDKLEKAHAKEREKLIKQMGILKRIDRAGKVSKKHKDEIMGSELASHMELLNIARKDLREGHLDASEHRKKVMGLLNVSAEVIDALPDSLRSKFVSVSDAISEGLLKVGEDVTGVDDGSALFNLSEEERTINFVPRVDLTRAEEVMLSLTAIATSGETSAESVEELSAALGQLKVPPEAAETFVRMINDQREATRAARELAEARREAARAEAEEGMHIQSEQNIMDTLAMSENENDKHEARLFEIRKKYAAERDRIRQQEIDSGVDHERERQTLTEKQTQETELVQAAHEIKIEEMRKSLQNRLSVSHQMFAVSELDALRSKHEQELQEYRNHGLNVSQLLEQQAAEITQKQIQMFANSTAQHAQMAATITNSVKSTMGVFQNVANARMKTAQIELKAGRITQAEYDKSAKEAGAMQEKLIIAQGVYHAFMGIAEQANALSAFASFPNPLAIPKGLAHQAAAVAHFANAAFAPEMARHARVANQAGLGGGGVGGGGGGGGARLSGSANYMERAELSESQKQNQGIQFGDIVLADIPYLFGADGATALGRHIAGAVVNEVNQNAQVQGGYRISRRASRRS